MDNHLAVDGIVLVAGLALAAGVLIAGAAQRSRVPGLLVFMVLGMLVADDGLELVRFDDPELAQSIAVGALVLILFEGGLGTPFDEFRAALAPATALAVAGVAVTGVVVAGAAALIFDLPANTVWLIAAVVAPTDAAAVLSVLRRTPVSRRVATVIEAESGLNDPIAVLLAVGVLTTWEGEGRVGWWVVFGLRQVGLGALIGLLVGWLGARLVNEARLEGPALHAVLAAGLAAVAYGAAALAGASGLLAVYLTGLLFGRGLRRHRDLLLAVHSGFASVAEIALFTLLGLLVFPSELPHVALRGLALAAVLSFVARPAAVVACLAWFGMTWREMAFVAWAGLRGAVPIVLAIFAITADHPDGDLVFNVVFFVVLVSLLAQGTTIGTMARRLGLRTEPEASHVSVLALDVPGLDVVELTLEANAGVVGHQLREVPMPGGLGVSAIVRGDESFVPNGRTELQPGDTLVVVADATTAENDLQRWAQGAGGNMTG